MCVEFWKRVKRKKTFKHLLEKSILIYLGVATPDDRNYTRFYSCNSFQSDTTLGGKTDTPHFRSQDKIYTLPATVLPILFCNFVRGPRVMLKWFINYNVNCTIKYWLSNYLLAVPNAMSLEYEQNYNRAVCRSNQIYTSDEYTNICRRTYSLETICMTSTDDRIHNFHPDDKLDNIYSVPFVFPCPYQLESLSHSALKKM